MSSGKQRNSSAYYTLVRFVKCGYLTLTVSNTQLMITFTGADDTHRDLHEQTIIDLSTQRQI
jgi:hypothetical protein